MTELLINYFSPLTAVSKIETKLFIIRCMLFISIKKRDFKYDQVEGFFQESPLKVPDFKRCYETFSMEEGVIQNLKDLKILTSMQKLAEEFVEKIFLKEQISIKELKYLLGKQSSYSYEEALEKSLEESPIPLTRGEALRMEKSTLDRVLKSVETKNRFIYNKIIYEKNDIKQQVV